MRAGAWTPEELEALLEDAFVTRDAEAVSWMFADGGVLVAEGPHEARGEEAGRMARALWDREQTYVAEPRRVVQARDIALVVSDRAINVLRRKSDGTWRYAISLLSLDAHPSEEES
jgi:ketosteroid isomerase-like protein